MKFTISEILNMSNTTKFLMLQEELSFSTSFKIVAIEDAFQQARRFYDKKRMEIITEFAEKDENGRLLEDDAHGAIFAEGMQDKCLAKIEELQLTEVEVSIPEKIKLSELSNLKIKPRDLAGPFVRALIEKD